MIKTVSEGTGWIKLQIEDSEVYLETEDKDGKTTVSEVWIDDKEYEPCRY